MKNFIKIVCYCKLWYGVNIIGLPEVVGLYAYFYPRVHIKSKFHK
jgi:hypothetical protein